MKTMKTIPPPHPNPSRPAFAAPPGACDAHCHVFGPAARFPYAPERRYTPPDAPKERLAELHAHLGLSRAILVQASPHGRDNSAMLDAIATSQGRWRGVAIVGAEVTDRELVRLHDGGVRGVRFNFVRHLGGAPPLDVVTALQARIAPMGWHLVLHLDAEDIVAYEPFFRRFTIPFVIDHMGRVDAAQGQDQPPFRELLALMRNELAWVKVSGAERVSSAGPPFADAIPFAQALIAAAPDRVLWGTDFPHPNVKWMPDDGVLVDLFARFTQDPALRRKVLVDNPTRLAWNDAVLERDQGAREVADDNPVPARSRPVKEAT
jgi:predicted TIM-barrel fold metal-dependent hydrolase